MFRTTLFSFLVVICSSPALMAEPAPTPESHLLLPYFEVSLKGQEQMTFLSIVNSGNDEIFLTAKVYSNWAIPMLEVPIHLTGKEVKSINLRDWVLLGKLPAGETVCPGGAGDCLDLTHLQETLSGRPSSMTQLYYGTVVEEGVATGFITIEADNGFLPESDVLWGDYFYTDPVQNFAQGQRLVRLEPDLSCTDLCYRHSIRFLEGGGFSGGTKLTVWNWDGIEREPSEFPTPQFELGETKIDVYSEQGELVNVIPHLQLLPAQTILVSDLDLGKSVGWFDLTTLQDSSVSGFYRAMGRFSVGVPSWCLPCDPCNMDGPCYEPGNPECTTPVCIPARLSISGDGAGVVGTPFLLTYRVSGSPEVLVEVTDLPSGLVHNNSTISGIPNEEKDFTISVINDCGQDEITIPIGPSTIRAVTLTVTKEVINDDGGTATFDQFELFVDGQNSVGQSVHQQVTSGALNTFLPGTYTVSEVNLPGYSAGSWTGDCSSDGRVTMTEGAYACRIVNYDQPARLTLVKRVINDDEGTARVSDFPLFVDGQQVSSGVATELPAGTYTASEQNLPEFYTAGGWTGDCDANGRVTLALGDDKTCTITNNDRPVKKAYLTLIKTVVNDHGGTAKVSDFDLFIDDQQVASGYRVELRPGSYTASEHNLPGYTAGSWTGDCAADGSVTLAADEDKVCRITNDDQPARIKLIKRVVNDNGGTARAADFELYIGAQPATSGVFYDVAPGTYTASERNLPGYAAGPWGGDCSSDGTVTVALGETKVCEITNDDEPARIKLIKRVVNDDGGTAVVSDFELFIGNQPATSGVAYEVAPGTYVASERNLPGYAAGEWGGDCSSDGTMTVGLGELKVCEITNDDEPATIKLIKHVVNDDGGTATVSDFELYIGNQPATSGIAYEMAPGTYTASERNLPGYVAGTWGGDCAPDGTVTLALGEHKTCEITNDDEAVTPYRMTGGGSVFTGGERFTHGFELHCDGSLPNNLEINWGNNGHGSHQFHLTSLDSAVCSDDPSITEAPPVAGFDTFVGTGTGRLDGVDGATITFTFTDAGEPGKGDVAQFTIVPPDSGTPISVAGVLQNGNHQAHGK